MRTDWSLRQVHRVLLFGYDRGQGDEVRNDSNDVYDIHDVSKKIELVRTGEKSDGEFEGEPDDADRLDEEEGVGDVRHLVLLDLGAVGGRVEDLVVLELGQGLQAEDHDGQQDHKH